jgi:hypothetical protein
MSVIQVSSLAIEYVLGLQNTAVIFSNHIKANKTFWLEYLTGIIYLKNLGLKMTTLEWNQDTISAQM